MTIEQKLQDLMEGTSQITEAKKDTDDAPAPDDNPDTPAVAVENPINPVEGDQVDADGDGVPDAKEDPKKVQESISDLLGTEFTEDFKIKATAIFEASLKENTEKIRASLQEEFAAKELALNTLLEEAKREYEDKLASEVKRIDEETSEKIDGYLDYMAEDWVKNNELAIESGIKAELTESFIAGMKTLFEQHYVDLPEEKVDLVNQLTQKTVSLEESLSSTIQTVAEITKKYNAVLRENIIKESAKDFTALDGERFKLLVEDFEFESEDTFRKKVDVVKTAFFEGKTEKPGTQLMEENTRKKVEQTPVIVEEKILESTEDKSSDNMSTYLKYLSK